MRLPCTVQNQIKDIIKYSDSINSKPSYIDISIEDRVTVIKTLNNQKDVFNYLRESPKASLVTSIRIFANDNIQNQLQQADGFYLQTDNHKKQWLLVYKNEKEIKKIDMNSFIVFGYDIASFCWGSSEKNKIKLTTLVGNGQKCIKYIFRNQKEIQDKKIKKYLKL